MAFTDLPHEIVVDILWKAVDAASIPSNILRVCKLFHGVGTEYLYTYLRFTSTYQLHQFVLSKAPQPLVVPRSLAVDLTGKAQRGAFHYLCDTLTKCQELTNVYNETPRSDHDARLKCLRLRMHSYSWDSTTAISALEEGLQAVDLDAFEWTGPDPDHHFSIAIVPLVATCLFKQFLSWSNIREITVTNISFPTIIHRPGSLPPLIEDIPSLRRLYIGQATFLHAQAVASMLCQGRMAHLETVRLVDTYSESIWGPRLRRSDVEKAATMLCRTGEDVTVIARIKRVVTCEKKTERIMGGDRVDGIHILE